MDEAILRAFDSVCDGFSADRVVADPGLNARFIAECKAFGIIGSDVSLNRSLLNLRKRGALRGRPRSKRTNFKNEDDYRFAAEMAVRFIERRHGKSLDEVICDPELAFEFDTVAARIAPGFSSLQYRWAALGLRKRKELEPEILARVAPPIAVISCRALEFEPMNVPPTQGLYLFFESNQLLYVGETENLRSRLIKHLDHSDRKELARWLWEFGIEKLHLEVQVLQIDTPTRVRKALETELIRSREPVFNVKR